MPGAADGVRHDLVEPERREHRWGVRPLARELDDVGDEQRQLLELLARDAERRLALRGRELGVAGEQLDVGPDDGDRCPQLVGRIGHEPSLRALRLLEGGEHLVEALREACQLVVTLEPDPTGQVAGLGDLTCGLRQASEREHGGPGDDQPEHHRQTDTRGADHQQPGAQLAQHVVDLVERTGELEGRVTAERRRQDPQVRPLDRDVAEELVLVAGRDGARVVADRQRGGALAAGTESETRGGDHLRVAGRTAEPRWWPRSRPTALERPELAGPLDQRRIDLLHQLVLDEEVRTDRGGDDGHRDREPGRQRQPRPEAHDDSRSA